MAHNKTSRASAMTLFWTVLGFSGVVIGFGGCAGLPKGIAFPDEIFTADQLYQRRAELNGKTVHALFLWQYNFEVSDTSVRQDHWYLNLDVTMHADQLRETSSVQWHTLQSLRRNYWRAAMAAGHDRNGPNDLWLWLDADVQVTTRSVDPSITNIRGPIMDLNVVVIRKIREGEAPGPIQ